MGPGVKGFWILATLLSAGLSGIPEFLDTSVCVDISTWNPVFRPKNPFASSTSRIRSLLTLAYYEKYPTVQLREDQLGQGY